MNYFKPKIVKKLSHSDKINYIRLSLSENVGPKTFISLLSLYQNIEEAIFQAKILASRGGKRIKICSKFDAENEHEKVKNYGGEIISFDEEIYPTLLTHIDDFPPLLNIFGNQNILTTDKMIAIIGSRNYSANGYNFTKKISKELVLADYVIVSGLAKGIDSAAHTSALDARENSTIAVIAGGINNIFPPENIDLYKRISNSGLIIAEMPYDTIPKSQNFPRRNRIISGLSRAVVIMEASLKSGSLITAKFALEQNREIFAVPGFPLDPRYEGNNKLIREGANILTDSADITTQLNLSSPVSHFNDQSHNNYQLAKSNSFNEAEYNEARKILTSKLNASPSDISMLVNDTQIPVQIILTILLELELAGKLERHYGNKVSLIYST